MSINSARFTSIYKGLSSAAQKVYGAVPINGAWDVPDIMRELKRTGIMFDQHHVSGCLNTLVSSNVVLESRRGYFTRERIRGRQHETVTPAMLCEWEDEVTETKKEDDMATQTQLVVVTQDTASPLDPLSKLSARVMVMSGQLKALANDIDNAALEIAAQMENSDKQNEKLRQLQSLLKGLV